MPDGVTKLKGYDNEYRMRIRDYRVRYEILDANQTVLLLQCKHIAILNELREA
ncbi:MAG: type II toxin-antitoxin system RelE family toxin, partial [Dolichospermum sp.]